MNGGDVPEELAEELLVRSLHRCAICQEADVQIHHMKGRKGENANLEKYLIPVCPNCHSKAQGKGGHGRQYTIGELQKYKSQWFGLVEDFHRRALSLAVSTDKGIPMDVHPGVVPSLHKLYLVLDAAFGVLDIYVDTGGHAKSRIDDARSETAVALRRLENGERIYAEHRLALANLIEKAAEMKAYTRIREMNHILTESAEMLRQ